MSGPLLCCNHLSGGKATSPFGRVVALGYYDGPTSGVLQCATCPSVYRFEMLDWNAGQDVRVFSLARLPPGSLERVVDLCPKTRPPQWPIWVPLWEFATQEEQQAVERQIEAVLNQGQPPDEIIAWSTEAGGIVAARALSRDELSDAKDWFSVRGRPARDWLASLGLPR